MTVVYSEAPPSDVGPKYLVAADFAPGEHSVFIRDWESRGSEGLAVYLKGFRKPLLLDKTAVAALGRDFKEMNWDAWFQRGVTLSISETEISVRGVPRYAPPAPKPSNDIASDLAAVLSRAITTTHDRNNMVSLLRGAADLLLARQ
jgi:hypothetical protein